MTDYPIARKNGLVVQEASNEVLVFDTKTNKAHCLNETAAAVWNYCDGETTAADIALKMSTKFGASVPEEMVWLAIDQLRDDSLLENGENLSSPVSRRNALKKIGFAAAIALPIVASLVAPTAALAVACSGVVTSCTGCNDGTICGCNAGAGPGTGTCNAQACSC